MIGLGSNRLSVCRRGGMSVTQAGRGGMEWLAGFRAPSWASPYSAQATAALKAQFPTQWPTIRDYGFDNPQVCQFISDDPMLICSLMPTLGVGRYVGSDGLAWILSDLKLQSADIVEVVGGFDVPDTIRTGSMALFGMNVGPTSQSWMNPNQIGMNDYHPDSSQDYDRFLIGPHAAATTREFPRRQLNYIKVDFGKKKKWVNGVISTVAANFNGINMAILFANDSLPFYASNTNGTVSTGAAQQGRMLSYFKVTRNGEVVFYGSPFVGQSRSGMMDAITGKYYPKQGEGSFTEVVPS